MKHLPVALVTVFAGSALALFSAEAAAPSLPAASGGASQNYKPDLATGRVPTAEETVAAEKAAEAHPQEFRVVRKLGKTYFYLFFSGHEAEAAPKALSTLSRALLLKPGDAETLAFMGSVDRLTGKDSEGRELMAKAREIDPVNIGVLGLLSGFGDVSAMEQLRAMPEFASMSDHGRQRVLLGLGKDRARTGKVDEARALLSEGLGINRSTGEARMLAAEVERLK